MNDDIANSDPNQLLEGMNSDRECFGIIFRVIPPIFLLRLHDSPSSSHAPMVAKRNLRFRRRLVVKIERCCVTKTMRFDSLIQKSPNKSHLRNGAGDERLMNVTFHSFRFSFYSWWQQRGPRQEIDLNDCYRTICPAMNVLQFSRYDKSMFSQSRLV